MSRTPSPTSGRQSSPRFSFDHQSSPLTPGVALHHYSSAVPSPSIPSEASLNGNFASDRHETPATPNTPASRLDMHQGDRESLLNNKYKRKYSHVKHYEQKDSWMGLVKAGTVKLLITILLGGVLCLCLKAWEGFHSPIPLTKENVRIFNALTIAISICLGLNILASLKSYAVMVRWSILTRFWVSTEVFDLILGIDEPTNVVKLFILSVPALRRHKWFTSTPQRWTNTAPGTNRRFAYVCLVWLLINIGSQVLVASLSLFWPMEPYKCDLTKHGDVIMADLSKWDDTPPSGTNFSLLDAAWRYGMDAQSWQTYSFDDKVEDLSEMNGTPLYEGVDFYEYRFFYRNPRLMYSNYVQSDRSIRTKATCEKLDIDGGLRVHNNTKQYFVARVPGQAWQNIFIPTWGSGLITWHGLLADTCGPRCSRLTVLQLKGRGSIENTSLWFCKNIVLPITHTVGASIPSLDIEDERINGTDTFARIAAGAITWSGISMNGWNTSQFRLYTEGSPWSPYDEVSTNEIEKMIMRFTIGAIAAFDDHGERYKVHINDEYCDKDSSRLNVGWRYITSMLGAIGLIQFGALCYLIVRGDHAIVRDANYFSTAMILKPVIDILKDEPGIMTMSGREIMNHDLLRFRKIRYGYKNSPNGGPRRITVAFEDEDRGQFHRRKWPSGDYS